MSRRGIRSSPGSPFNEGGCGKNLNGSDRTEEVGSNFSGNAAPNNPAETAAALPVTRSGNSNRESLIPHNKFVVMCMKVVAAVLVCFFFVIPAFVKIYPAAILDVAFLNHFRWPPLVNLSNPKELGLNATRHFFLDSAPEVTVGVWHILPEKLASEMPSPDEAQYISLLQDGSPIVLYLHGNAGTRAAWHRVQLYRVLTTIGFHVVTIDYRGYGDSTGYPSEEGIVEDSIIAYKWIRRHSGESMVLIWGHSLGSAVATKTAKKLNEAGENFDGLILESPFNNFIDAASHHPLTLPFRVMPWFSWVFIEGIKMNNIRFASDENIAGVTAKTLILHALDDGVVPYALGRKLYDAALRTKRGGVEFVTFDGQHGYGHKHIHKDPNLPEIIRKFTALETEAG